MTDQPAQVRYARRFVATIAGQPDIHGIQFPDSGHVLADVPHIGLTAFLNVDVITDENEGAVIHWAGEQDTSPVTALYEQWVKAGPPPLGALLARWWDMRLAELHRALTSPAEQPARTTPNNPTTSKDQ